MRDILFRGKRKDNSEWVYGDLMHKHYNFNTKADKVIHNNLMKYKVVPETVGQFTGLSDKNSKKIFEGDIIKAMMDYGPAGFYERIVPIKWLDNVGYQWQYFDIPTIEIIGNIHDNPELLGGEH
jgi:hypothetical protein